MKKTILSFFMVLALSLSLYALPVGNPAEANLLTNGVFLDNCCYDPCATWCDKFSFRAGFYGDYIYNRNLRNKSANEEAGIRKVSVWTNAALLTVNLCDRADVFVTLGASSIDFEAGQSALMLPGNNFQNDLIYLDMDTAFSWSIGGRATLCEYGCFTLGAEGQYFCTNPQMGGLRTEGDGWVFILDDYRFKYQDWQVALGASYRVNIVDCSSAAVPYAAVRWGGACVDTGGARDGIFNAIFDQEEARPWGWAFGLTFVGCDRFSLTAEGRWASETALHINTQFRF